jgi:hypothetical protein
MDNSAWHPSEFQRGDHGQAVYCPADRGGTWAAAGVGKQ